MRETRTPYSILRWCPVAGAVLLAACASTPSQRIAATAAHSVPRTLEASTDANRITVSGEDIQRTGRTDLGAALRALVPIVR